jgi:hypothetical protein
MWSSFLIILLTTYNILPMVFVVFNSKKTLLDQILKT